MPLLLSEFSEILSSIRRFRPLSVILRDICKPAI